MRFLHTVSTLNYGGVERLVTELALEQQRQGHLAAIYCYNHKTGGLLQRLASGAVPVFGPAQPAVGQQRQAGLAHCVREWRPDIVHAHLNFSVFSQVRACSSPAGPKPKFMVTQHSAAPKPAPVAWRAWVNDRLARRHIQCFTAVSRCAARHAARFYGLTANQVTIIYNGVRPEDYPFDPVARNRLRQALALPPEAVVWGTVGRLVWLKGHDVLIRAFARARQADPRLVLVLVGAGPELARLQALSATLGVTRPVIWPGESSDMRGWLSAFDQYVHASRYETLSLAILEALANGLPVVATRVGGVAEIADLSPQVRLVPGEQAEALGDTLIEQSARPPCERGASKLPEAFLFETMYRAYTALYQELSP